MLDRILPPRLIERLDKVSDSSDDKLKTYVSSSLAKFLELAEDKNLYFFVDYTDHGINHTKNVLKCIDSLIPQETLDELSPLDIIVLATSVVLHDIGMLTNAYMFKKMIDGEYDKIEGNFFNEKSWKELWKGYLKERQYWNREKKCNLFGEDYDEREIRNPNLNDLQSLSEYDKHYIGEFIRRHHARIAYEIALKGYWGVENIDFERENLKPWRYFLQISGLVARSHGVNLRKAVDFLENKFGKDSYKKPNNIKIVFLMVLIRLADYLQIDSSRTNETIFKIKQIHSPISRKEHETHLSIDCVKLDDMDKERIIVEATPEDAVMYVKIKKLVDDIQKEFDISWAVLGEVYNNQYLLSYRRIVTRFLNETIGLNFVPKRFGFKFNNELSKLLIRPLYGDDPKLGVRELVQNAVDACRIRIAENPNQKRRNTHVKVSLKTKKRLFTIEDYGIGMTLEEIENYFLTIGSSYDSTIEWKKTRDSYNGIYRTGHFGIGVLAAFLLGDRISVETKSTKSKQGYAFTASLQDSFIQINKIEKKDYGTKISIICSESCLKKLAPNGPINCPFAQFWTNWYVDSLPKVEYSIDDNQISASMDSDYFKENFHYLELDSKRNNFLYWEQLFLKNENNYFRQQDDTQPRILFINGFQITSLSHKKLFHLHGLEKYHKLIIPSLYLLDFDNEIPLNLDRSNIDEYTVFPFEKELAIAMYKDMLCKLLAIDIVNFLQPECLLFNSCGFILNSQPYYPFTSIDFRDNNWCKPYVEGVLSGKYIIHLGGVELSHISLDNWRDLFDLCPDVFFSFHINKLKFDYLERIHKAPTRKLFKSFAYAVNDSEEFEEYNDTIIEDRENIGIPGNIETSFVRSPFENKISQGYRVYHRLNEDYNEQLINKVILFFNSNKLPKPAYILVHKVEGKVLQSDVDDFFIDYAGGNMVVPYDEDMRRKKFKKLYDECSENIEKYKSLTSDEFISECRNLFCPNIEI